MRPCATDDISKTWRFRIAAAGIMIAAGATASIPAAQRAASIEPMRAPRGEAASPRDAISLLRRRWQFLQ